MVVECRLIVSVVLLLFSITVCRAELATMRITDAIDNSCGQEESCVITLKSVIEFDWDRLVIFTVGSSNDEVSKALGFRYPDSTDLMAGIVFARNGKIVQNVTLPYHPEKPNNLSVKLGNDVTCRSFSRSDAVFLAERIMIDRKAYYVLGPPAPRSGHGARSQ